LLYDCVVYLDDLSIELNNIKIKNKVLLLY